MSNIRYLIDLKNRRSFCLGDRYYGIIFHDVTQPLSLKAIEVDITEHGKYGSPELARKLWAFCEVASWKIEQRYENTEYGKNQCGDDGFISIGSVWHEDNMEPDPCAKEQAEKEQVAEK